MMMTLYVDAATYNQDIHSRDIVLGDLHSGTGTVGMGGKGGCHLELGIIGVLGGVLLRWRWGVLVGRY